MVAAHVSEIQQDLVSSYMCSPYYWSALMFHNIILLVTCHVDDCT